MNEVLHHTQMVRRLYRPDLPAFRAHLIRLDPETRYDRFGLQVSDDYLAQYAELCFAHSGIVYGWFEDGVIRGAAELRIYQAPDAKTRRDGEAAFSVERRWRRRGIGTELMGHVVLAARNRSIRTLTVFCLRHNKAMQALARKFEADLAFDLTDVTGHLTSRAPDAFSLWREAVDNALDFGSAMVDYQGRLIQAATKPA
jgi:GNAT superfamily N-acetyltransferase